MMNLTVDIGNSRVKLTVFDCYEVIFSDVTEVCTRQLIQHIVEKFNVRAAIICSVTGYDYDYVEWLKVNLPHALLLDSNLPTPVINGYKSPETLGMDRLAAVAGAVYMKPGVPLLVVDAGTAITYDFVTASGVYKGGNIAPGAGLRFSSLHEHTSRLPFVSLDYRAEENFLGGNTADAIWNGVVRGIAYEIDGYITSLKEKEERLEIFFTGGDAFFFEKYIKSSIFVVSNLTSIGLNAILNYNLN